MQARSGTSLLAYAPREHFNKWARAHLLKCALGAYANSEVPDQPVHPRPCRTHAELLHIVEYIDI